MPTRAIVRTPHSRPIVKKQSCRIWQPAG
jgi:hypothetical protein